MSSIIVVFILVGVGVAGWFCAERIERQKNFSTIKDLQNRLRYSDTRVLTFKEQLLRVQTEARTLKETLECEREARGQTISALKKTFRKGALISSVSFLSFGVVFGSVVSGLWVKSAADQSMRSQLSELHVVARVADMNAQMFREQAQLLNSEIKGLRQRLDYERVEKAVALTKLKIILDSVMDDKWKRAITLDPKKIELKWNQTEKTSVLPSPSPLVVPTVAAI